MSHRFTQKGFAALETLLIIIILALVGFIGWYVWHGKRVADKTLTQATTSPAVQASPYVGWKTYIDAAETYLVKYPGTWTIFDNGETPTLATDVVGVGPKDNDTMITISSYPSSQTPKAFQTSSAHSAPLKSQDLVINGNGAYYEEIGDSTYTNLSYAIGKNGRVVTVTMTQKSTNPLTDNSQYVDQFNQIAKSVQLK